jgi:hypothetical protein
MPERREAADTVREVRTSVTFPDSLLEALKAEAKAQGVPVAQYIREASVGRLMFDAGRRRNESTKQLADELAESYKLARKVVPPPRRPSD